MDARTDDELLAATRTQPDAFAVFYRRHVTGVIAYFARRTRCAETAADLAAETFAAALDGAHRHRPDKGPAVAWLYGIARRQLIHAAQKGAVEDRARRRLGMNPIALTDEGLERVEALATADAASPLLREGLRALPARPARGGARPRARRGRLRGHRAPRLHVGGRHPQARQPRAHRAAPTPGERGA